MPGQLKASLNWKYMLLVVLITAATFASITYIPNVQLLNSILFTQEVTFYEKLSVILGLFKGAHMNDSNLSILYSYIFSFFSGVNVALIIFVFQKRVKGWGKGAGLGLAGMLGSMLGIGCAACGSLVLAGVAYIGSITPLILSLPFQGAELEVAGFTLMLASTVLLIKEAIKPLIC